LADDVEFYHDQGGVTLGKEKLTESVKKNICGKVTRELDHEKHRPPKKGRVEIEIGKEKSRSKDPPLPGTT